MHTHSPFSLKTALLTAFTAAMLAACGDGGGNSNSASAPAAAASAPVAASSAASTHYVNEFAVGLPENAPTIIVATEAKEPPFEFRNKQGYIIGFEVDLITAAAASQGIKVNVIDVPWNGIFTGLENKSYHLVMGTAGDTAERRAKYALSNPYYATPNVVVVPKDSPIQKVEDLNGKKVGVMAGGVAENDLAKRRVRVAEYVPAATSYIQISNLATGKIDAAITVGLTAAYYADETLNQYPIRLIPFKRDEEAQIYFVMNKENNGLLEKINAGLDSIKQNGTFDKIHTKWLGHAKKEQ